MALFALVVVVAIVMVTPGLDFCDPAMPREAFEKCVGE